MTGSTDDWPFPPITDEVVQRYRRNYSIPTGVTVTRDMVEQHTTLEHKLKQLLSNSKPETRCEIWASSYDQLYRELPWLAEASPVDRHSIDVQLGHFLKLIPPGSQVIEIGSGVGLLAHYLTEHGRPCVATEITGHRGIRDDGGVAWHSTDGIHLDAYEPESSYDFVLSTQVIEHFHPEDVARHFEGAYTLLKPGGKYILETPHAFFGPADLSRVFCLDRPQFMHLKEYTHRELGTAARGAGFENISAVYIPPTVVRKRIPAVIRSRLLYNYLSALERLFGNTRPPQIILRALLFHGNVFLIAGK
ncbi:class I SAM-dependent methyltransferase [Mycolicibacterium stellerae]|uniref:class I SAM-dependent methyltransferase n=1 Tax=Mycolicibacterium stellerae TaxID=2358193 RepID=UPI0013DDE02F|nr:class I SAM-dependent methyltransferase [Mycolicibacterium stellerae]